MDRRVPAPAHIPRPKCPGAEGRYVEVRVLRADLGERRGGCASHHAREHAEHERLRREYLEEKGHHVGVGRPLEILAVVPWRGKLYWAKGAVYSYYQFARPLTQPLTDEEWKRMTLRPLATQMVRPWLFGKGVGIDSVVWSAKDFKAWLPKETDYFGNSFGGGRISEVPERWEAGNVDGIGFVSTGPDTVPRLGKAFAEGHHDGGTRWVLFTLASGLAADERARIATAALKTVAAETRGGARRIDSIDYRLWTYLSLRLLEGVPKSADVAQAVLGVRRELEECARRKPDHHAPEGVKQLLEMTKPYVEAPTR